MVVIEKKWVWCRASEFEAVHSNISTLYTEWLESYANIGFAILHQEMIIIDDYYNKKSLFMVSSDPF